MKQLALLIDDVRDVGDCDNRIVIIKMLTEIYKLEEENISGIHSEIYKLVSWSDIVEYYNWIRFVFIRMKYNCQDNRILQLKQRIDDKSISYDAVKMIGGAVLGDDSDKYLELLDIRNDGPLVSVVVPVYNGAGFVRETIDSILNQSYQNIELIIIDDASTDSSKEVILSYKDSRVRSIFLDKNRHVCYASNTGFKEATGKYVALCGHDDVWKPDKLEKQVAFLEEHPNYGVCFTLANTIDEDNNTGNTYADNMFSKKNESREALYRRLIFEGNCLCAPSACIRREVLEQVGYYRYAFVQVQDYDLWLRVVLNSDIFIILEKLVCYRRFRDQERNLSSDSVTTSNRVWHECQCINSKSIKGLSKDTFIRIFKDYFINEDSSTDKEIACEKGFLLWNCGLCFAVEYFAELLEDEETRMLLEEKYNFTLPDFYKMNTKQMRFDLQDLYELEDLKLKLESME